MTPTDAELLRAFATHRTEDAFAELVRRHGPLVRAVCRRALGDVPEADDCFQAAFLVLAGKAGTLRDPSRLGPFLYGVALKVAGKAKAGRLRRQRRERPMNEVPAPQRDSDWADVRPVLDAEVGRLPAKLREALVLCELQGVSRDDAASRLGVPAGTLASRLARAKDALRVRLVRRGLTLSAAGLGAVLAEAKASAAVPAGLVHDTAAAAAAVTPQGGSLVGKLLLMLVAAGGLTLAGVGLVPADKPPVVGDPGLAGRWRVTEVWFNGDKLDGKRRDDKPEMADRSVTVTADRIVVHGAKAGRVGADLADDSRYTAYPYEGPAQIDVVPEEGRDAGRKLEGVFRRDGDTLTLHFAGRAANRRSERRPADFTCRADGGTTLLVLRRDGADKPADKPDPAADLPKLQGRWVVESAEQGGRVVPVQPGGGPPVFTVAGDRLTMAQPGGRAESMRLKLDGTKAPKWLDLTLDARPADRPQTLLGLYQLDGDTLTVGWTFGERPKSLDPAANRRDDPDRFLTWFKLKRE